jgi:GDP-L-fucose synthase
MELRWPTNGIVPAQTKPEPQPEPFGTSVITIGTGRNLTIRDLTEMVAKIVGFEGKIHWDNTKPDGTHRKLLDISRLKSLG